jgi:hypothetical protein
MAERTKPFEESFIAKQKKKNAVIVMSNLSTVSPKNEPDVVETR